MVGQVKFVVVKLALEKRADLPFNKMIYTLGLRVHLKGNVSNKMTKISLKGWTNSSHRASDWGSWWYTCIYMLLTSPRLRGGLLFGIQSCSSLLKPWAISITENMWHTHVFWGPTGVHLPTRRINKSRSQRTACHVTMEWQWHSPVCMWRENCDTDPGSYSTQLHYLQDTTAGRPIQVTDILTFFTTYQMSDKLMNTMCMFLHAVWRQLKVVCVIDR